MDLHEIKEVLQDSCNAGTQTVEILHGGVLCTNYSGAGWVLKETIEDNSVGPCMADHHLTLSTMHTVITIVPDEVRTVMLIRSENLNRSVRIVLKHMYDGKDVPYLGDL